MQKGSVDLHTHFFFNFGTPPFGMHLRSIHCKEYVAQAKPDTLLVRA